MGRKKLPIVLKKKLSERHSTFQKRRVGLIKKISELATLCGIAAGLVIISAEGESTVYTSGDSFEDIERLLDQTSRETQRSEWTGAQYPEEKPTTKKKPELLDEDEDSSSESESKVSLATPEDPTEMLADDNLSANGIVNTPDWIPENIDYSDFDFMISELLEPAVTQALPNIDQFAHGFDNLLDPDQTPQNVDDWPCDLQFWEVLEDVLNVRSAIKK